MLTRKIYAVFICIHFCSFYFKQCCTNLHNFSIYQHMELLRSHSGHSSLVSLLKPAFLLYHDFFFLMTILSCWQLHTNVRSLFQMFPSHHTFDQSKLQIMLYCWHFLLSTAKLWRVMSTVVFTFYGFSLPRPNKICDTITFEVSLYCQPEKLVLAWSV